MLFFYLLFRCTFTHTHMPRHWQWNHDTVKLSQRPLIRERDRQNEWDRITCKQTWVWKSAECVNCSFVAAAVFLFYQLLQSTLPAISFRFLCMPQKVRINLCQRQHNWSVWPIFKSQINNNKLVEKIRILLLFREEKMRPNGDVHKKRQRQCQANEISRLFPLKCVTIGSVCMKQVVGFFLLTLAYNQIVHAVCAKKDKSEKNVVKITNPECTKKSRKWIRWNCFAACILTHLFCWICATNKKKLACLPVRLTVI